MKPKLILCLALVLSGVLFGCSTATKSFESTGSDVDKNLKTQISDVLTECQMIKPGMMRAELLKSFIPEGGISTATHRTFVHRHCPYIKVDVEFSISEQQQQGERPTDTISKISKPYLEWSIID